MASATLQTTAAAGNGSATSQLTGKGTVYAQGVFSSGAIVQIQISRDNSTWVNIDYVPPFQGPMARVLDPGGSYYLRAPIIGGDANTSISVFYET